MGVGSIVNPPRSSYTIPRLNTCLCNITDAIDGADFDSLMNSSLFENCGPPARIFSPRLVKKCMYSIKHVFNCGRGEEYLILAHKVGMEACVKFADFCLKDTNKGR